MVAYMFAALWHNVFFDPIYNGLIFIAGHLPGADVGVAIILLTVIVKVILLPLSIKAARAQYAMRFIEPKLKEIKEKYKDDREALGRNTMAAYKEAGINPLLGIFLALIQIPVIIALYLSVYSGGGVKLPAVNEALLYDFVRNPGNLSMLFLGLFDITGRSAVLAVLAGATQYVSGILTLPSIKPKTSDTPDFKEDLARSMQLQMKYAMPVIILFVAYTVSAAVALYFVVSNLMSIIQEYIVRMRIPDRHSDIETKA